MIRLEKAVIHKYKSFGKDSELALEPDLTILIGENEAGKTCALEAMAKADYMSDDKKFQFEESSDLPRKTSFDLQKEGRRLKAITLYYVLDDELIEKIEKENPKQKVDKYIKRICYFDGGHKLITKQIPMNKAIYKKWIAPNLPKFIFYDNLPIIEEPVSLIRLAYAKELSPNEKAVKALFAICRVTPKELLEAQKKDDALKILERMGSRITRDFLNYWDLNQDLRIEFSLTEPENLKKNIFNKLHKAQENRLLSIRIYDAKEMISLPLNERSAGFQWFFSFYVWFTMLEQTLPVPGILLFDEPGVNLHGTSVKNMLSLMKRISQKHQVIMTTHSITEQNKEYAENIRVIRRDEGTSCIEALAVS